MTDRPILYTGEMIRALDRKTQTRRLSGLEDVNSYRGRLSGSSPLGPLGYRGLEPTDYNLRPSAKAQYKKNPGLFHWFLGESYDGKEINPIPVKCPYGVPGDRLWVKEAWKISSFMEGEPIEFQYRADGAIAEENDYAGAPKNQIAYEEWCERVCCQSIDWLEAKKWPDNDDGIFTWDHGKSPLPWRPSIFMPRWASRITLEIVSIGVERVDQISDADTIAEGIIVRPEWTPGPESRRAEYGLLWDKLNAKQDYSWDKRPFVWKIEFRRI